MSVSLSCYLSFAFGRLMGMAVTTKKGKEAEKVDVHVLDDTAEATLTLWGRAGASAFYWKASYTILLISQPSFNENRRPTLGLSQYTHVDVDPCMIDGYW